MRQHRINSLLLVSLLSTPAFSSQVIYGFDQAKHIAGNSNKLMYFLQIGSFSTHASAAAAARSMRMKTKFPVLIMHRGAHDAVQIGPLKASEVRKLGNQWAGAQIKAVPIKHRPIKAPARTVSITKEPASKEPVSGAWYLTGNVGGQYPKAINNILVLNGSGFPAPYNNDTYTTRKPSSMIAGVGAGYRFVEFGLPAASIGVEYTHQFNAQMGDQVIQYSLPQFTNYNYRWKVESDILLVSSKLNIWNWNAFMPYIKAGAGVSFNRANRYRETALAGVTARISPGYGTHTSSQFAYRLGAGVDWVFRSDLLVSLGYEYADLGSFSSANGTGSWSRASLASNTLTSNAAVLGVTYLFHG